MKDYLRPLFADPITPWHRWFAWRPVETSDRGWVWLRFVYRRRCQVKLHLDYHGGEVWWQTAVDPHLERKGGRRG